MNISKTMNFSLLLQRKRLLLASGLLTACAAFGLSKILPMQYAAEGAMVVETAGVGAAAAADEGTSVVQTQIDVLQSKGLLARVVHDLNVDERSLVPRLRLPAAMLDQIDNLIAQTKQAYHSLNGVEELPPGPNDANDRMTDFIQKHLTVTAKTGSKLIAIRSVTGSPDLSSRIVNGIMNDYMGGDSQVSADKVAKVNEYIDQQTSAMQTDVNKAQQRLATFVKENNLPDVGVGTSAALQLSRDQEALSVAKQQYALRKAAADTIRTSGIESTEEALESNSIQTLKSYEAQVQQQLSTLGPLDPRRATIEAGLKAIRAKYQHELASLQGAIERNVQIAQAKVSALQAAVTADMSTSADMSNASTELKQLTADVENRRQALLAFLTQAATLRSNAEQSPSAHVSYEAEVPLRPINTFATISILLGFVTGVAGAAGTVLIRDAFGTRISTTLALELVTGLPSFGSLPNVKQRADGRIVAEKKISQGALEETFRSLWITMRSENRDEGTAAVITSSEIGEGKSTMAKAIAQQIADDGYSVLLIDGDLRRPRLSAMMKVKPTGYLETVLDKSVQFDDAIFREPTFGYDCLFSNGRTRNPARLLTSQGFTDLITDMKKRYNFVIIDTPPVLHVADPVLISSLCDYILFVVESDNVSGDLVAEATRRFNDAGRNNMLTLLTRVKPGKMDRRDFYSGYHGSSLDKIGHDA